MADIWIDNERLDVLELRRCDVCGALTLIQDNMFHWEVAHGRDN